MNKNNKIKFCVNCSDEYKNWDYDEVKCIKTSRDIISHYISNQEIYDKSCLNGLEYNKISFDIMFFSGEQTHNINKEYRNKDYAADIITFAVFADSEPEERFILDLEINLGEVIIAIDKIEESARDKQIDFESELTFMISHGIMHLLGFDHQTQKDFDFMVNAQKSALKSIGIAYDKI